MRVAAVARVFDLQRDLVHLAGPCNHLGAERRRHAAALEAFDHPLAERRFELVEPAR